MSCNIVTYRYRLLISRADEKDYLMDPDSPMTFGPFRFDPVELRLWRGSRLIPLRARPAAVLCVLLEKSGQLVSSQDLLERVWSGTHVSQGVVRKCIHDIRTALGERDAELPYIHTVGRQGYCFRSPYASKVVTIIDRVMNTQRPLIVGRQMELDQLQHMLHRTSEREAQLVFVSGEAGMGKTALIDHFLASLTSSDDMRIACGYCIDQHGEGEPYMPLLGALEQLGGTPDADVVVTVLRQVAPTWLIHLPNLVSEAERDGLQRQVQGTSRSRMLRELAQAFAALTAEVPLVLVLEDLHWSDPSTVEALDYLERVREPMRLLVIGTYRPESLAIHNHPLQAQLADWQVRKEGVKIRLSPLGPEAVAACVADRLDGAVAAPVIDFLHTRSKGNALFLICFVEHLVHQGLIRQVDEMWQMQVASDAIASTMPRKLGQLLHFQIERLPLEAKGLLEAASVAGETFAVTLVAAGLQQDLESIEGLCEAVANRTRWIEFLELERWPDETVSGRYRFRHMMYHQVVYEFMSQGRRLHLHRRIGQRLEIGYGAQAETVASELAHHFTDGEDVRRSAYYRHMAGQNALKRSAYQESIAHCRSGLALLQKAANPDALTSHELDLHMTLGTAVLATKGYGAPEAELAYERARALCHRVDATAHLMAARRRILTFYMVRGETQTALDQAMHIVRQAERDPDPRHNMMACMVTGMVLSHRGELRRARTYLEQALATYDPHVHRDLVLQYGHDPGVICHGFLATTLGCLGYLEQARHHLEASVELARELAHPYNLSVALLTSSINAVRIRDVPLASLYTKELITLSIEQDLTYVVGHSQILQGWVQAALGDVDAGTRRMRENLEIIGAMGGRVNQPFYSTILVEMYNRAERGATGAELLESAWSVIDPAGYSIDAAELHRLHGEHQLKQSMPDWSRAEASFQQAIETARSQHAKLLELRASMSLGRLRLQQGRPKEARALIGPVYDWFGEGFDTVDLRHAGALLERLGT